MIKRLVSFACCLLPLGAGAVNVFPEGNNVFVSTEGVAWQDAIVAGETIVVGASGAYPTVNAIKSQNGFSILNNMYVGRDEQGSETGDLYILNSVVDPFTIETQGDVSIGAILQVLDGMTLAFKNDTSARAFNVTVGGNAENQGILVGEAGQTASLLMQNVGKLKVEAGVRVYGDFSVEANSVEISGGVDVNSGDTVIDVDGAVSFAGLTATGDGTTDITADAGIISNGVIQNNAAEMTIVSNNAGLSTTGLENQSNSDMVVNLAGAAVVTGTLVNSSQAAALRINASALQVSGGAAEGYSLINNGDFYADITGQTLFTYGVNLSGMNSGNEFYLKTGTLQIGQNSTQLFSNYLNDFDLIVTQGGVNAGVIQNGVNVDGKTNAAADMSLNVNGDIVATSVTNTGKVLSVVSQEDITVGGVIVGAADGQVDLIAAGQLGASGAVTNQGNMVLNANTVILEDVTNSGTDAVLNVTSLPDITGKVQINGTLLNDGGTTDVSAKDVSVSGVVKNNSGTITVLGSDTDGGAIQIGALDVAGGVVNLNALAGAIDITNAAGIVVSGGTLNFGASVNNLNVNNGSVQVDGDIVAGAMATDVAGDMNIAATGNAFVLTAGTVSVDGNIDVTASDAVRNIQFDSVLTQVAGDVSVANYGMLTLGKTTASSVDITGDLIVGNGGVFESYANEIVAADISNDNLMKIHGANLTASDGDIDITGNLYFDPTGDPVSIATGMVVRDTDVLNMNAAGINVGAISVGSGNTLNVNATDAVVIDGAIANNGSVNVEAGADVSVSGAIANKGTVTVSGALLDFSDVSSSDVFSANATDGNITFGNITNSSLFDAVAATNIVAKSVTQTDGVMNLNANKFWANDLTVSGATTKTNLNVDSVVVDENVNVAGSVVQGGNSGMLNHFAGDFSAYNLDVGGDFMMDAGDVVYNIGSAIRIGGNLSIADAASAMVNAGSSITAAGVQNDGFVTLSASYALNLGNLVNNSGELNLNAESVNLSTFAVDAGNVVLSGQNLNVEAVVNTTGVLYQGYRGVLQGADVNVKSNDYVINTANLNVGGINQNGRLVVNSSDIDVGGNISATDLRFVAVPTDNWMNVNVQGSVLGQVDFIGLEKMTIGGDYVFGSNSNINAVILPYALGSTIDSTDINYWSTVGINSSNLLTFENASDGSAMINVEGKFTAGQSAVNLTENADASPLAGGQVGISLRDVVDQGTAIWFVHADGGIEDAGVLEKARNLSVRYCNADGTLCYDYLESLDLNNATGEDLPAYIAARDNDLYVVFDPRFGGPIEVFKIQPIVAADADNTRGEIVSAGALDNMIAGRLQDKKFFNRTPIEVIPLVFQGTNMQEMAGELYNRMEYYAENDRNSDALARFSRLFQPREIEQIMGTMVLNEHTVNRSFEDRMFDEFIWNRNRNLKKAWMDVDYGMLYQNIQDGKHTDGNRFSISGGFDWQETNTLQLGLMGRVSHTVSKASDKMDLGYLPGQTVAGHVETEIADTDIALGGYLMETVNEKVRIYGNAMIDMHVFDTNRSQNYVDTIDGDGTAFALTTEWGVLHDVLNQYVVGNLYARAGYNFGFEVKEKVGGEDYMRMQSDGYWIFTPGYSLTAQKRIYPSAWFQIRPYASVGFEYDILGAPDKAEYKFVSADIYSKYKVEIDPLWANIGGGVEFLAANGVQIGVDYRYQYNADVQLHNIKLSGSYRF